MRERIWIWLAWFMPKRLVYWCAVRLGAHATFVGVENVPEMTFLDALKRWSILLLLVHVGCLEKKTTIECFGGVDNSVCIITEYLELSQEELLVELDIVEFGLGEGVDLQERHEMILVLLE